MIRMAPVNVYQNQVPNLAPQIAGLGDAFFRGYDGAQQRALQQEEMDLKRKRLAGLAALGSQIGDGNMDYNKAAAGLISSGDLQSGIGLLTLGEKARERQAQEAALRNSPFAGAGLGAPAPSAAPAGDGMARASGAISSIESGGRYDAMGPVTRTGDRAFGKYQVMGANIPAWTKQYLGREMTPQEFIASPEAQERVFQGEFGRLKQKHGPEGAARAWFAGEGGMNDPGRKDILGTTVEQYGRKFAAGYGQDAGQPQQVAQVGGMGPSGSGQGGAPARNAARAIPPGDPYPNATDEQIAQSMFSPSPQVRELAKQIQDQRARYRNSLVMNPLEEEAKRLDIEAKRRQLQGEGATPLTPEERAQFGITGDIPAYRTRDGSIKFGPAGTKIVNQAAQQETKFAGKMGEIVAKQFEGIMEEGNSAAESLKLIEDLKKLGGNFKTGAPAVVQAFLGRYGIETKGLSDIQAYEAIINRLAPQQRVPGSGATSDFDAKMFLRGLPQLINTPEGNQKIIGTFEALYQNKIARADVAFKVAEGELTQKDGLKELRRLQAEARKLSEVPATKTNAPTGKTSSGVTWSVE